MKAAVLGKNHISA